MALKVKLDTRDLERMLTELQKKQLPFATAQAVNDVAFQAMRAERAAMPKLFAHPRPFTQRAPIVALKAKKGSPTAIVTVRPEAARYLEPYEDGGLHALPGKGQALLNPKGLKLDGYGQIRGMPRSIGDRANVFVGEVQTKHGPIRGFWRRLKGRHLQLLIRFGDALPVKKRLHFADRAEKVVQARFTAAIVSALGKAMSRR